MNPEQMQQTEFITDLILLGGIYLFFGVLGALMAVGYRKENRIKPMKGWRAVLITLLWPIWFTVFFSLVALVSIWNFLWSDVE